MDKKNGIIIVHVPQNGDEFRRVLFFLRSFTAITRILYTTASFNYSLRFSSFFSVDIN